MRSMVEGDVQVFPTVTVALSGACPLTTLGWSPSPGKEKRKWPMEPVGSMGHRLAEALQMGGARPRPKGVAYAGTAPREVRQPCA